MLLSQVTVHGGLRALAYVFGATQTRTGKLRVFREHELTVDMLLASACLPKIHHAVEIDGEACWDGGYAANPAVFPLFYDCDARDVLLVLLSTPRAGLRPARPPWGFKQSGKATFA